KSIATILTSLGSPICNDDVVTIALECLPDKNENFSGIIVHREPFPVLKTVHSMLTNEEMRLKSRAQATSINSTSYLPMVLLANSGNNTCLPPVAPAQFGYLRNNNDMVSISNASNATVTPLAFHTGPGKPLVGFTSLLGFSRPLFGLPQFGNQPTRPTQALSHHSGPLQ
ncbi:hypothetical protein Tco_1518784, partial [Tanacetum coccineum]